jgi:hypothetical protein
MHTHGVNTAKNSRLSIKKKASFSIIHILNIQRENRTMRVLNREPGLLFGVFITDQYNFY